MRFFSFFTLLVTGLVAGVLALPSPAPSRIPTGPGAEIDKVSLPGYNNQLQPADQDSDDDDDADRSYHVGDDLSEADDSGSSPYNPSWTFNQTCSQLTLTGHGKKGETSLAGNCQDQDGIWWQTSLNLNLCFENDGGVLQYQDSGNFDDECHPCMIDKDEDRDGLFLKCNCLNNEGIPQYTFIGMGPRVDDPLTVKAVAGRLICGDQIGNKSPNFSA